MLVYQLKVHEVLQKLIKLAYFKGGVLPLFSCMLLRQMIIEGEATTEKEGHGLTRIKGIFI